MVCGNPAVGKTELIDSLVCNFVRGFLKKRNFSSHGHSSGIMDTDSSFDYRKTYGIFVQNINLSGYQVSLLISIRVSYRICMQGGQFGICKFLWGQVLCSSGFSRGEALEGSGGALAPPTTPCMKP